MLNEISIPGATILRIIFVCVIIAELISIQNCSEPGGETEIIARDTVYIFGQDLWARYNFSGNAIDSSEMGRDGIVNGPLPTFDREGIEGGALVFESDTQFVSLPTSVSLHGQSEFTIATRVKLDQTPNHNILFFESTSSPTAARIVLSVLPTGEIALGWRDYFLDSSNMKLSIQTEAVVPFGEWIDIAVVWDAVNQNQLFYLNGDLFFTGTIESSNLGSSNAAIIRVGRIPTPTLNYFNGEIDELVVLKRALNSTEIAGVID